MAEFDFRLEEKDMLKVKDAVKAARNNAVSGGKDATKGVGNCCG